MSLGTIRRFTQSRFFAVCKSIGTCVETCGEDDDLSTDPDRARSAWYCGLACKAARLGFPSTGLPQIANYSDTIRISRCSRKMHQQIGTKSARPSVLPAMYARNDEVGHLHTLLPSVPIQGWLLRLREGKHDQMSVRADHLPP